MNIKQLQYFVEVSRRGSLSHAATALRMGQPALSRHIRTLELELRRNLFHRNGRGVVLTDAGARFLAYAQGALSQLDSARAALDGSENELTGRVVVGLPPSIARALVVPLVRTFQMRYGCARIAIAEALSTSLQEQVLNGRIDVAVMHNPGTTALLNVQALGDESLFLLSPVQDAVAFSSKKTVAVGALTGLRLIAPARPHFIISLLEAEAIRQHVTLNIALEVEALPSIPGLVQAGCGHAVVPESVLWTGLSRQDIAVRKLIKPSLRSSLALVSASRRPPTLLVSGIQTLLSELLVQLAATTERSAVF